MNVTKTQGSFPSDDGYGRPAGTAATNAAPGTTPSSGSPDLVTGADRPANLPDLMAAGGRLAGRIIESVVGAAQSGPGPAAQDESVATPAPLPPPKTTGVIFVHGIGSQLSGETLLQWSAPLIEVITAWKSWAAPGSEIRDPVRSARIDFKDDQPRIELTIPGATVDGRTFASERWILTESWWAARISPPSLSTMTSWLGPQDGASQIVNAILGNRTDGARGLAAARTFVIPFVSILAALVLSGYTLVRGLTGLIPIQAVQDAAILKTFDNFLTGWFGDVRVLVFDPAQSANIRAGLAAAIRRFREVDQVDSVVVVAHSGGAMVSYLTLSDPTYDGLVVDKLITFGEGWNLAMVLTPEQRGMADRLRRDVTKIRPDLRWRDYWASHDPAPAGMVRSREMTDGGASVPDRIRSRQVWNRRSLIDDHGSYFDNDEEFTLSVLREIDNPKGWGETTPGEPPESRFYPTPPAATDTTVPPIDPRERRHRERVAMLALWRQLCIVLPIATIAIVLASSTRLGELGQLAVGPLMAIPIVHDIGALVINFLRSLNLDAITTDGLPFGLPLGIRFGLGDVVDLVGLAALQAIVLVSVLQLISAPVEAYQAWRTGSLRRRTFLAVEVIVDVVLVGAVLYLGAAQPHATFLDAGLTAWLPGIVLTLATLVVAFVGARLARRFPFLTRPYAVGAMVLFLGAMLAAVLVIFRRDQLEVGELGYAVIWLAFLILYRLGHDRWSQWDRIERRVAYRESPDAHTSRMPVWFSMVGFTLAAVGLMSAIVAGPAPLTAGLAGTGIALIVAAVLIGAKVWKGGGSQISSPTAVESARGRV